MNESSVEFEGARQIGDCSGEKGVGLLGLVSPGWWERLDTSVVSGESVNSRFDEDKSELTVSVGSELLNMLSDVNGLLDKMVKIFWERWCNSVDLQNSEDLGSSDSFNLRNTVLISEDDTDLRWGGSSLGHFDNLFS